jgi:CBS domain-containing protein
MLSDIWKRGIDIQEVSSQAGTKLPSVTISINETAAAIVDKMFKNAVTSVLLVEQQNPVGVLNDRDLLQEIVEKRKNPEKTLAKDLNYTPLINLKENETMISAMKLMEQKGIKRAALVKNGQLVGMLMEPAGKKGAIQVKPSLP